MKFEEPKAADITATLYKPKVGCTKMGVLYYYVSTLNGIKSYTLTDVKKLIKE